MTRDTITIQVCTDCYFAHHGVLETPLDELDPKPWALYGDETIDVTSGLMASEHAEDCAFRTSNGEEPCTWEGECETTDFSTSRCDGCGQHLAGTRHAMTQWYEEAGS